MLIRTFAVLALAVGLSACGQRSEESSATSQMAENARTAQAGTPGQTVETSTPSGTTVNFEGQPGSASQPKQLPGK